MPLPWPEPQAASPPAGTERRLLRALARLPRLVLRLPILVYRYSLSSLMGRQCRYLPTCSEYADTAIQQHGAWAGGWMATARLCRCHPWGGDGFDPVPQCLPAGGRWDRPWRYGLWRQPAEATVPVDPAGDGVR